MRADTWKCQAALFISLRREDGLQHPNMLQRFFLKSHFGRFLLHTSMREQSFGNAICRSQMVYFARMCSNIFQLEIAPGMGLYLRDSQAAGPKVCFDLFFCPFMGLCLGCKYRISSEWFLGFCAQCGSSSCWTTSNSKQNHPWPMHILFDKHAHVSLWFQVVSSQQGSQAFPSHNQLGHFNVHFASVVAADDAGALTSHARPAAEISEEVAQDAPFVPSHVTERQDTTGCRTRVAPTSKRGMLDKQLLRTRFALELAEWEDVVFHKMRHPIADRVAHYMVSTQAVKEKLVVLKIGSAAVRPPLKTDKERAASAAMAVFGMLDGLSDQVNLRRGEEYSTPKDCYNEAVKKSVLEAGEAALVAQADPANIPHEGPVQQFGPVEEGFPAGAHRREAPKGCGVCCGDDWGICRQLHDLEFAEQDQVVFSA